MPPNTKSVSITSLKIACHACSLRELCLPVGLAEEDLRRLDDVVKRRRPVRKGEFLYRVGDPLHAIYAVRRGTLKTTALLEDGREHITGFYLPGELLGFDAINDDRHPCDAEAVEHSEVCELPFARLEELAQTVPGLQHQLFRIMSREIVRDSEQLALLGHMTAEERLAACLLDFSRRREQLGLSGSDLSLAMSRQDLGHYLGLALETVSRLLSRFQADGLIALRGRSLRILDFERLQTLAGMCSPRAGARRQGQVPG